MHLSLLWIKRDGQVTTICTDEGRLRLVCEQQADMNMSRGHWRCRGQSAGEQKPWLDVLPSLTMCDAHVDLDEQEV